MTKIVLKQKFKEKFELLGVRIIFHRVICTADIFQPTLICILWENGKTVRKNGPPLMSERVHSQKKMLKSRAISTYNVLVY